MAALLADEEVPGPSSAMPVGPLRKTHMAGSPSIGSAEHLEVVADLAFVPHEDPSRRSRAHRDTRPAQ
jgi:hypothetical protein